LILIIGYIAHALTGVLAYLLIIVKKKIWVIRALIYLSVDDVSGGPTN